ncbi:MAG: hypothetical protein JSV78_01575 [Phycisphaerales bacterium]|nr:MAG: hypothetical protein JSV78_01575 [Phycisphaerales bacterium]
MALPGVSRIVFMFFAASVSAAALTPAGIESHGDPVLADRLRHGPGISNHPVNVLPSQAVSIPADWPLSNEGAITCLTCHVRLPSMRGDGARYLRDGEVRATDAKAYCARCHATDGADARSAMHWIALDRAHYYRDDTQRCYDRGAPFGSALDAESRRCLSCHDGVTAGDSINPTSINEGSTHIWDPKRSHPVGVLFPRAGARGCEVSFRSVALLPPEVRLPEGKVSCVSCHDLYARDRHLLSVPIEGSALCFACHDMD